MILPNTNTQNLTTKNIILMVVGFSLTMLFSTGSLFAQQNEWQILPLDKNDYKCMQQLSCVTESEELHNKGWIVAFDETITNAPQERTARLEGEYISLIAHYDKKGNLLRGTYKLENVALPNELLAHLAGKDFSGWTMAANKMSVRNFDVTSTVYNIILENETDKKTVRFTHADIMEMKMKGLADLN